MATVNLGLLCKVIWRYFFWPRDGIYGLDLWFKFGHYLLYGKTFG